MTARASPISFAAESHQSEAGTATSGINQEIYGREATGSPIVFLRHG